MRVIASGLILFSCGAMGLIVASSYAKRALNLRQLIKFMQVLESEVQFAQSPLPQVIAAQAGQFSGATGDFLSILDHNLQAATGERFSVIWKQAVDSLAESGCSQVVIDDLISCGTVLGTSDVTEQTKHIKQLLLRLEQALKIAEEEREKHTRLWQYLGFSAGLLIVLLLV